MDYILVTDVGSTTTKARFFKKTHGEWRYVVSGEAPTTVEAPYEDVTAGVRNAIREVEEHTNQTILSQEGTGIITPSHGMRGVDIYCTTSSAGGGLQMIVTGVTQKITAESANRAALGAGAIVMDILSLDEQRETYQKIQQLRDLRPDMILLAGGTDGGTKKHPLEFAELIKAAKPNPRLGISYKLPIVYAGNKDVHSQIQNLLGDEFALQLVDNIRPVLETENTEPARRAIHELFMEHVMSHAPGYTKLMKWTDVDIMPTPAGEGIAMQLIANQYKMNVIGVGLGGATTNIYSIVDDRFVRSVSANLGMSYSICNVMKEVGLNNIKRWLPFQMNDKELGERLANKMIRPTTIPQSLKALIIEQAVAREAIGRGLVHHKTIATRLKGTRERRALESLFDQGLEETYVKMMDIDVIVGTGGLLSHAPRRIQSLLCLTDAFQAEGVTRMFQDSVFMMPHLGVLSTVNREAAWQIFDKDCLVRLGTVIAPRGLGKEGEKVMDVTLTMPDGQNRTEEICFGDIMHIPLLPRQEATALIDPTRNFDVGAGNGHKLECSVMGGEVGIILDARGRPLQLPDDEDARIDLILKWYSSLGVYPKDKLDTIRSGVRNETSISERAKRKKPTIVNTPKETYAYAPGLKVKRSFIVRKERKLPLLGEVLIEQDQELEHDSLVARTYVPGDPYFINATGKLDIEPKELPQYLLKKEGDPVEKGETIAQLKTLFGLINKMAVSPITGSVETISEYTGQIVIREKPKLVDINAYIPGKVTDILPEEGAIIETNASFIQGIFGIGGETYGELKVKVESFDEMLDPDSISPDDKGCILVGGSLITPEVLQKAVEMGVNGIVSGGIRFLDLIEFLGEDIGVAITGQEEVGLTVIITEGFGSLNMSKRTFDLLKSFEGYTASINGATQIRAGVMRPELIIPHNEVSEESSEEHATGMVIGTPVRIIRHPYFGEIGKVADMPIELQKVESEAKVRVLDVEFDDGRIVTVPRANVEIIEV